MVLLMSVVLQLTDSKDTGMPAAAAAARVDEQPGRRAMLLAAAAN